MSKRIRLAVAALTAASAIGAVTQVARADVSPPTVERTIDAGESFDVEKKVTTAAIPVRPDIFILADTTGSMAGAINDVKLDGADLIAQVEAAQPEAMFGAGQYKDQEHECPFDPFDFQLDQAITADNAAVLSAVGTWTASGGCDWPENWLHALYQVATDSTTGFRSDSTRIVVIFGDADAHDDGGPSLATTIAALQAANIRVIAVNTGAGLLDATGQATAVTEATGGVLLTTGDDVTGAILTGLGSVEVEVTPSASCDPGLSASFAPASQSVTSGDTAAFTETIAAAPDATGTLTCTVNFLLDGNPGGPGYVQTVTVIVNGSGSADTTPPVGSCVAGPNPGGNTPKAPGRGGQAQNPDGFYTLSGTDDSGTAVSIVAVDNGSGYTYGPFAPPTNVKYTQAIGATPSQQPGSGVVAWNLKGKGDLQVIAIDASGNRSAPVSCLVPPSPK